MDARHQAARSALAETCVPWGSPVLAANGPAAGRSFDVLVENVLRLCDVAARECGRAAALCQQAVGQQHRSRWAQLSSRRGNQYARIEGTVDGKPAVGIVRRDGSIYGDRSLLERIEVVVAMKDSLADGSLIAGNSGSPLVSTLTATRACDEVLGVEVFGKDPASRGRRPGRDVRR